MVRGITAILNCLFCSIQHYPNLLQGRRWAQRLPLFSPNRSRGVQRPLPVVVFVNPYQAKRPSQISPPGSSLSDKAIKYSLFSFLFLVCDLTTIMSPSKVRDVGLEVIFGAWTFDTAPPHLKEEHKKHKWYGFDPNPGSHEPMYAMKKLNVSTEYEFFQGMPFQPVQVAELTPAKISVRGTKYYSETVYCKEDHGLTGLKGHMNYTKYLVCPLDGRDYRWNHSSFGSSFYLEDVLSKEVLVTYEDWEKNKKCAKIQFSSRLTPNLEFWLLALMHYMVNVSARRKEAKENVTDLIKSALGG